VGAQPAALGPRQGAVELARHRALGLAARDRGLELLAHGAAGAEEQRLDGGLRKP
jgi:hypothetical protein